MSSNIKFLNKGLKNNLKIVSALTYHSVLPPSPTALIGFPLWLPPFQRGSSVLSPSLAFVATAHQSSRQFFRALSNQPCKVNSPRGPVSCGDQSQLRREDRRAALRRQDPREKPKQVDIFWIVLLKPLHCIIIAPSFARVHLK